MAKQKVSVDDRRKKIMSIAATQYHGSDDAAQDYLAAIEGASIEEQKDLFRLVLSTHSVCKCKGHKCPPTNSIKLKEWQSIAKRVGDMVTGWSRSAIRNNATLHETADMLWDELTLREGKDRAVALGILLDQAAVPYAQLPGNLTIMKPLDVYSAMRTIVFSTRLRCSVEWKNPMASRKSSLRSPSLGFSNRSNATKSAWHWLRIFCGLLGVGCQKPGYRKDYAPSSVTA